MKYLWIGNCMNEAVEKLILEHGGKTMSVKISQDNWVSGLDSFGLDMDSINSFQFPLSLQQIPRVSWSRNGRSADVNVAYRNGLYRKIPERRRAMVAEVRNWAAAQTDPQVTVLVYSMHSPFLAAALEVKRLIPTAKILLIVPDLPQFMDLGMNRVKKVLKWVDWQYIRRAIRQVDRFVLYSVHMAEFLHLKPGSYCVLEGSVNPADVLEETPAKPEDTVAVMYSGVTDLRYGLPELLDAFALLEGEQYRLWITGSGNAVPLIEERARQDHRIRYLGYLPSRRELLLKQKEATMLINVRKPDEAASAYCFPSKLFEYMVSGNPVLSFRIPGIPEEYFDYLIPMEQQTPAAVAESIRQVAYMPPEERAAAGARSREFVLREKNITAQAKRLLDAVEVMWQDKQ